MQKKILHEEEHSRRRLKMTQAINTNVLSLQAQRNLSVSHNGMTTAIERLSSGLRINGAKDDAAGLAISTRFTAQINGLNQAVRNANDGISLLQVAEGAMQESTNVLQRMRSLAVQSANGTYSDSDRNTLNDELLQLQSELDRIGTNTSFNNINIVNGTYSATGIKFQVGANADQFISIKINDIRSSALHVQKLDPVRHAAPGVLPLPGETTISTIDTATTAITNIDSALDIIVKNRAALGAIQNRFEYTVSNLSNVSNNLSAANSRILDTDFALETAHLTKYQILQQAGIAMLSQANSAPQSVLSLLK